MWKLHDLVQEMMRRSCHGRRAHLIRSIETKQTCGEFIPSRRMVGAWAAAGSMVSTNHPPPRVLLPYRMPAEPAMEAWKTPPPPMARLTPPAASPRDGMTSRAHVPPFPLACRTAESV